jgi:hypothetical protein
MRARLSADVCHPATNIDKPLQQGKDGVPYAKEEDLESETGGMLQNIVADSSNSITVLVSTLLDGKRRFIEVP